MNKEENFKDEICSSLRNVADRENLKRYCQSLMKVTEETGGSYQTIVDQIQSILNQNPNQIKGIDDQLIRENCHALADRLETIRTDPETELVERVLTQFRQNGFLTRILQRSNSKSKYCQDMLRELIPENEYDVQHLLFSLFRVLFQTCRTEVNQDDGHRTVRSDISISENTIIEVKSTTRSSLIEGKLIDEICSDIARFHQKNHYFFIYDSRSLIKDRDQFELEYSKKGKIFNKNVKIYVCYPYLFKPLSD